MTALHRQSEHDANAWEATIERVAERVVNKVLKERNCSEECGALIRIQEQLKSENSKHLSTDEKIEVLFKKFETVEGLINKLILDVMKGSVGIISTIILSVILAFISKAMKMW
jgi:hypothetical protein